MTAENSLSGVFHRHKHLEHAKGGGNHHAVIIGHNGFRTIADKGPLALGRQTWTRTVAWALEQVLEFISIYDILGLQRKEAPAMGT